MAQRLVVALESERTDGKFKALWQTVKNISNDLAIEPTKKRTVKRQTHCTNPSVADTESYYRVAYYFAFIDHTLSHLKTRFPLELEGALCATYLVPGNVANLSNEVVADIKGEFSDYLPYPSSFESEVNSTWKVHVEVPGQGLGEDLSST